MATPADIPTPGVLGAEAQVAPARPGLLVMAHGGTEAWNLAVSEAVSPLRERLPTALALGMADPRTLQAALDSLSSEGAETVVVVRLFISGASFWHQTEFLFGLREDPPVRAMIGHSMGEGSELDALETDARILLDAGGMAGEDLVARILEQRARSLVADPAGSAVMLVAHGMGAEDENERLLAAMEKDATVLRERGFADVRVATLREDWAGYRARAERRIRDTVSELERRHEEVAVIPYRLFGFGPYATVLEGLEYRAGEGLLPHPLVSEWILARAIGQLCSVAIETSLGGCATAGELTSR